MFNEGSGNKPVYCNILEFTSGEIYEYDVMFETVLDEHERATTIKNYFTKISRPYIYDNLKLYVCKKLNVHLLKQNLKNEAAFSLIFVQKKKLNSSNELLGLLLKQCADIKHLDISSSIHRLLPNLTVTGYNNFLCINCEFYVIKNESLRVLLDKYKELYLDDYVERLERLLKRFYIYHKNGNVYKCGQFLKEEQLFRLEGGSKDILALPDVCHRAKVIVDTYQTPNQLMVTINSIYLSELLTENWNLQFISFAKANSKVLKTEKIIFGGNTECVPVNGSWNSTVATNKPFVAVDLWCWCVLHTLQNATDALIFATTMHEMGEKIGIKVGHPVYFEIADNKNDYINGMNSLTSHELQVFVVIVPKSNNRPDNLIKYMSCIKNPTPVIIVHENDLKTDHILKNILSRINTIVGGRPWSIDFSYYQNIAVYALDVRFNYYNKTLIIDTFTNFSQWHTQVSVVEDLVTYLRRSLVNTVKQYYTTYEKYPQQVVIYQNCNDNKNQLLLAYTSLIADLEENCELCVIFVQKNTNLHFFPESKGELKNVPPGTIIDHTVVSDNCNFYLVTKYSETSLVSSTYYEVISNSSTLSEADLHTLTYKMCHINYEEAEISAIPAPCFYAEKVKKLILEEIHAIPESSLVNNFIHFL